MTLPPVIPVPPVGAPPPPAPENFIALAKLAHKAMNDRRIYEWKVNFSLWASIGLVVYAAVSNNLILFQSEREAYVVCGAFLLAYSVFHFMMSRAHNIDKAWKHFYFEMAEGRAPARPAPTSPWMGMFAKILWFLPPFVSTALLLYLAIKVLSQGPSISPWR